MNALVTHSRELTFIGLEVFYPLLGGWKRLFWLFHKPLTNNVGLMKAWSTKPLNGLNASAQLKK